jgi:hypothetical protein
MAGVVPAETEKELIRPYRWTQNREKNGLVQEKGGSGYER